MHLNTDNGQVLPMAKVVVGEPGGSSRAASSDQRESQRFSQPLEVQVAIQVENGAVPIPDSDGLRNRAEPSADHVCDVTERPKDEKESKISDLFDLWPNRINLSVIYRW